MRHWNLFSVLLLLCAAAWIVVNPAYPGQVTSAIPAPRRGFAAPDFTLETPEGTTIQLSTLRGHPVLVNLWASWCGPCKAEMKALEAVWLTYRGQGLQVLGVNATAQDSAEAAVTFSREMGLTFPILFDATNEASRAYQLQALPSTYFIGADGIIQDVVIGGPMSEALLRANIERLLGGG